MQARPDWRDAGEQSSPRRNSFISSARCCYGQTPAVHPVRPWALESGIAASGADPRGRATTRSARRSPAPLPTRRWPASAPRSAGWMDPGTPLPIAAPVARSRPSSMISLQRGSSAARADAASLPDAGGMMGSGLGTDRGRLNGLWQNENLCPSHRACTQPGVAHHLRGHGTTDRKAIRQRASAVGRQIARSPRLLWVCAVKRRRFPVGASPTRQSLQPEATGAGMEVTKCLKRASSEGWLDQQEVDLPGQ